MLVEKVSWQLRVSLFDERRRGSKLDLDHGQERQIMEV
jgi:hypothetical protein